MTQPKLAFEACPEKQEIVHSIQTVTEQIIALLLAEVDAVVRADMEMLERIEDNLGRTMDFQQCLRERYNAHIQSHGCTPKRSVV